MIAPRSGHDYWDALLEFGDGVDVIAIVDWRQIPDSIVERSRVLPSAKGLPIPWTAYAEFDGDGNESLFQNLNQQIAGTSRLLVSLDTGGNSYALVFVRTTEIPDLESMIVAAIGSYSGIQRF